MELQAPSHWQCVEFISDLHLQAADRATHAAWMHYLQSTQADAVIILGDLFEAWVGDDAAEQADSFEAQCAGILQATGQRLALYIMQGNRDFLMGEALMQRSHATALPDPSVLVFAGQRYLLSHGDALCLDDLQYQHFRREVRSSAWQQEFLAKSLTQRRAIAQGIRQASAAQKNTAAALADVDSQAARQWLERFGCQHLIHGHTHRPAQHALGEGLQRTVLSDWDLQASPARAELLRLSRHPDGHAQLNRVVPWHQRGPAN